MFSGFKEISPTLNDSWKKICKVVNFGRGWGGGGWETRKRKKSSTMFSNMKPTIIL